MSISIRADLSEKILDCVNEVHDAYRDLHGQEIIVARGRLRSSTMQVQPLVNLGSVLTGFTAYELKMAEYVRDSRKILVESLDRDVITGWLAHEFGHILDYQNYSVIGMARYGLGYVLSRRYARKVEVRADTHAVHHGFYLEVKRTKEFLMDHRLSKRYRDKIAGTYMSLEELSLCHLSWQGRLPG